MAKKYLQLFIKAILAGFTIGLGGLVYLIVVAAGAPKILGALLFAVGLFVVCTRGFALFTGKVCYLFENKPSYLLDLLIIWVGNLVGAMILGGIVNLTEIGASVKASEVALSLASAKIYASPVALFALGILCNIFIFIAVDGYAKIPHQVGKYLAILFGVVCFIMAGTEHCIADQFYFCVSKVLYIKPLESLGTLGIITLGNAVGGVLFPLAEKGIKALAPKEK